MKLVKCYIEEDDGTCKQAVTTADMNWERRNSEARLNQDEDEGG